MSTPKARTWPRTSLFFRRAAAVVFALFAIGLAVVVVADAGVALLPWPGLGRALLDLGHVDATLPVRAGALVLITLPLLRNVGLVVDASEKGRPRLRALALIELAWLLGLLVFTLAPSAG